MADSAAIRQSLGRLESARAALVRFKAAHSLDDAEVAWADFLLAGNGVYSKLQQGSKVDKKAAAWFDQVKNERNADPLLSYLRKARNAEEHTIDYTTSQMKAGQATLTIREPFDAAKLDGIEITLGIDPSGHIRAASSNEDVVSTKSYRDPALALVRILDTRGNGYVDPPYEHKGSRLPDNSPLNVGELFINHLDALIRDARIHGI